VPGCSAGSPAGRSYRAWTGRPGGGGRCHGASARSCPERPAAAAPWRRAFGITLSRVTSGARSAQVSFGQRGCRRCRTASWWRRIKISAVFHISSCRDSRSHAASRVIRRNTNRRNMIGDHRGRTAGEQLCWSERWMRFSARTGLPRSAPARSGRYGCLLYPGDGGALPDRMPCPASTCRFSAASPCTPHLHPTAGLLFTAHQRRFTRFTRPACPSPVVPGWGRNPRAFP
jgi:hypothetical protein